MKHVKKAFPRERLGLPSMHAKDGAYLAFAATLRNVVPQSPHFNDDPNTKVTFDRWMKAVDDYTAAAARLEQKKVEGDALASGLSADRAQMHLELEGLLALLRLLYPFDRKAVESFGFVVVGVVRAPLVATIPVKLHVQAAKGQSGHYGTHWSGGGGARLFELARSTDGVTFAICHSGRAKSFRDSAPPGTLLWFQVRAVGNQTTPFCLPVSFVVV